MRRIKGLQALYRRGALPFVSSLPSSFSLLTATEGLTVQGENNQEREEKGEGSVPLS
jgi:hypothetical protein